MSILELAETVQDVVAEERGYTVEIDLVENPRSDEAVADDFTVDTTEAAEQIGFDTEWTIAEFVRELAV